MQAVIFIGAQASGKSSFYVKNYLRTHVRINLDMLKTRHRERILLEACLTAKQRFVVDNTNPTAAERCRYIKPAKAAGFEVVGYYFQSNVEACLVRNAARPESERVPDKAITGTHRKLEIPKAEEGFDRLFCVQMTDDGEFKLEEWKDGHNSEQPGIRC